MLEFIFEALAELLLQILSEVLAELGLHAVAEPFRRAPNPWLAAFGYAIFGAIIGGISLLVFSSHFVHMNFRIANLVLTPIAAGLAMVFMGKWRTRRAQVVLRIDRFAYAYLFALAFALVRFWYAK